jgi:hypothetical protein
MKLASEQRAALLSEMRLAALFTEKRWAARYGVSIGTVRRLRAEARQRPLRGNIAAQPTVTWSTASLDQLTLADKVLNND